MMSRDAIDGMFAKRKAPGGPTGAPRKKKKKAAAAGPSGLAPEQDAGPVVGLEAPSAPIGRPEQVMEEGGEASESASSLRAAAPPPSAPSPVQSRSAPTGRRPNPYARGRPGEAAFRTPREGMVRVPQGESVVGNPELARELLEMTIAPRDETELGARTTADVLMSSYAGLVLAAHNVFSLEKAYEDGLSLARSLSDRVSAAEADRDAARESAQAAKDREKGLLDENARLASERAKAVVDAESARQRLMEIRQELETTRASLGSSEAAVGTAQAEVFILKLEVASAKEAAQQAAKEMEAARESAACAVKSYKASAAHNSDMVEASRQFYVAGFANCKKEIGGAFPNLDLSAILEPVFVGEQQQSESESETESDEGATRADPTAHQVEPTPAETETVDPTTLIAAEPIAEGETEAADLTAPTAAEPTAEAEPAPTAAGLGLGTPESSSA